MGRIIAHVRIENISDPSKSIRCDALVDTGAAYMVLPTAWKSRLGDLQVAGTVEVETATQATFQAEVCGPVTIQIEGFRSVFSEVLFLDMEPEDGVYEPLVGYIVLEQSQAGVDILGHRLVHIKHVDLKYSCVRSQESFLAPAG
jgi:predicted aspartyl protease